MPTNQITAPYQPAPPSGSSNITAPMDPATATEVGEYLSEAGIPSRQVAPTWEPRPAPPAPGGRPYPQDPDGGISYTHVLIGVGVVGAAAAGIWWYTSKPKRRRRRS